MEIPRPELVPPIANENDPNAVPLQEAGFAIQQRLEKLGIKHSDPLFGELNVIGNAIEAAPRKITLPAEQFTGEIERQADELLGMFESQATPPWTPNQGISLSVSENNEDGPPLFSLLIQRPKR